jgi:CRP-like cAMP-binding protein
LDHAGTRTSGTSWAGKPEPRLPAAHRDKFFVLESGVCDLYISHVPHPSEYSAVRESLDVKSPRRPRRNSSREPLDVLDERDDSPFDSHGDSPGGSQQLRHLGRRCVGKRFEAGMGFGELALLYSSPRTASVSSATACTLWVLERGHYSSIKRRFALTVRASQ